MTDDIVIRVEGLGKKYVIGHKNERERYVALRDVLARSARSVLRKSAAMAKGRIGVLDDSVEEFWALKQVSFEVKRGEVLGIIGRNGAGKSTLLKVLSRITEPSEGRVTIKGRVASLLEVGTGFHPELTGRENIYLNGAILGMTHAEIKRKFDEIVAFAEVEQFLDVPVKRYSSGMYVRLAFAVAAYLEPEILIVDEVLAVGDAAFQGKCLGRMSEVATCGRTVLFVSHNLSAITSLTKRCVWLDAGKLKWVGKSDEAIAKYRDRAQRNAPSANLQGAGTHSSVIHAALIDESGKETCVYRPGDPLIIFLTFVTDGTPAMSIELFLNDPSQRRLAFASILDFEGLALPRNPGAYRCVMSFMPLWLGVGRYTIDIATSIPNVTVDHYVGNAIDFDVLFCNPGNLARDYRHDSIFGSVALKVTRPSIIVPLPQETDITYPVKSGR